MMRIFIKFALRSLTDTELCGVMISPVFEPVAYLGFHFGGGRGFKIFLEKWGYKHGAKLGGSGACSPEKIFKNGAIWCVLESILLKFCQKNNLKNTHFLYKNNRHENRN